MRALSSFGRAPALQAGGDRFEPDRVHKKTKDWIFFLSFVFLRDFDRARTGQKRDKFCFGFCQNKIQSSVDECDHKEHSALTATTKPFWKKRRGGKPDRVHSSTQINRRKGDFLL